MILPILSRKSKVVSLKSVIGGFGTNSLPSVTFGSFLLIKSWPNRIKLQNINRINSKNISQVNLRDFLAFPLM